MYSEKLGAGRLPSEQTGGARRYALRPKALVGNEANGQVGRVVVVAQEGPSNGVEEHVVESKPELGSAVDAHPER